LGRLRAKLEDVFPGPPLAQVAPHAGFIRAEVQALGRAVCMTTVALVAGLKASALPTRSATETGSSPRPGPSPPRAGATWRKGAREQVPSPRQSPSSGPGKWARQPSAPGLCWRGPSQPAGEEQRAWRVSLSSTPSQARAPLMGAKQTGRLGFEMDTPPTYGAVARELPAGRGLSPRVSGHGVSGWRALYVRRAGPPAPHRG